MSKTEKKKGSYEHIFSLYFKCIILIFRLSFLLYWDHLLFLIPAFGEQNKTSQYNYLTIVLYLGHTLHFLFQTMLCSLLKTR